MRFLLFYAGVFALIALTAAVGIGVLATDRIVMLPGGRIIAQAVHRAVSFAAVGFLVIHIATEVLARRSAPGDAVVPFLDHGRTLFLGLGTVSSDLVLLIVATGIMRGRFATVRPAWMWRVLHATSYAAWPLAILHGLLAGRAAKPYVDWSYGACIAAVGLALVVRVVAGARVREMAGNPVPALGPWLPGGLGSPLEVASSLPLAYGGRERLAIAAPVAPDTAAGEDDDDPFDGELAGVPPYQRYDDESGDYPHDTYDEEDEPGQDAGDEPGTYEHIPSGAAVRGPEPYWRFPPGSQPYAPQRSGPGRYDRGLSSPPLVTPGPTGSGLYARAAYVRAAHERAAHERAAQGDGQDDRVAPGYDGYPGAYDGYPGAYDGYPGAPRERDPADLPPPLDYDPHYRGPYDPDLYGPEPPTDPRMYAPGPETWSAEAAARWRR